MSICTADGQRLSEYAEQQLPWLEFEIPVPPSKNQKMAKLGNSTPVVKKWRHQAYLGFLASGSNRPHHKCRFEVEFYVGRNNKADLQNYEEFLCDWLEYARLVENDRLLETKWIQWSDTVEKGRVLVRLRPWMTTEGK